MRERVRKNDQETWCERQNPFTLYFCTNVSNACSVYDDPLPISNSANSSPPEDDDDEIFGCPRPASLSQGVSPFVASLRLTQPCEAIRKDTFRDAKAFRSYSNSCC